MSFYADWRRKAVLEWIVSSSVLILAVVVLRRVLRGRISPRLQYAVWLIVLLRLLVPLNIGSAKVSVQNVVHEADTRISEQVVTYVNYELPDISISEPDPALPEAEREAQYEQNAAEYEAQIEAAKAETGTPVTLSDILQYVWYGGMAAMALWFLGTDLVFRARLRKGRERLEYDFALPVYVTDAVETPCLFGRAIYVTREAAADALTLRHSVEHELTHHRHGDHVWAILRCICLVLHWYNPLVWLAAMLSRRDAELACDEATIKRLGEDERAAYGRTLIGISCEKRATLLRTATTMNCGKAGLKERILLIAKRPKTLAWALIILILAAVIVTGCTFTGAQEGSAAPGLEGAYTAMVHRYPGDAEADWRYDIGGAELERLTSALEGIRLLGEAEEPLFDEATGMYTEPAELYQVLVNCGGASGEVRGYSFFEGGVLGLPDGSFRNYVPESLDFEVFEELIAAWTPPAKDEADIEAAMAAFERMVEEDMPGCELVSLRYDKLIDEYVTDMYMHDNLLMPRDWLDRNDFMALQCILDIPDAGGEQPETGYVLYRTENGWAELDVMQLLQGPPEQSELEGAYTAYIQSTRQDARRDWRYDIEGAELERLVAALEGMELVAPAEEPVYDQESFRYVDPATLYSVSVNCGGEDGSVLSYEFLEDNVVILPGRHIYTFAPESLDYALFDELMAARKAVTKPEADIEAAKAALERYIKAQAAPGCGIESLACQPETDAFWTDIALHDSRLMRREGLDERDFITLSAVLSPGDGGVTLWTIEPGKEAVFIMRRLGDSWEMFDWNQPGSTGEVWSALPAADKVSLGVTLTGRSPENCAWYTPEAQDEWRELMDEAMAAAQYGTHVSEGAYLLGQLISDGGHELYFNTDGSLCSLDENFLISAADAAPLRELADETLRSLGVFGHVEPADIHGLSSAAFTFFGGTARLTDEAALSEIERILSASTLTYPSQCGFSSVMKLECEDGSMLSLGMAGDGCGVWQSNGWFYSYTGDNLALYSLFAAQLIHDLDTDVIFDDYFGGALLKYLDWQRYCDEYGEDGGLALLDRLFDAAMADAGAGARISLLTYMPAPEGALAEHYAVRMTELQELWEKYAAEPWPEFAAGPAEGGYEFSSAKLGLTFTVPVEVSEKVAVASGVRYYDPDGASLTLYYVPENGRYPLTMFYLVAESPRADFFRPGSWYYSTATGHPVAATSENSVYFTMGPLGGSEIGRDDPLWDDYISTSSAVSAAIRESIAVDDASSIPALDTSAVSAAAKELAARGGDALTRSEAAQLAFGLLSAGNKAQKYPLDYTDVEPGSESAQAIAYLDSYGLLRRYSTDGEDLDGTRFRPSGDITRAEFVTLLHRLSFSPFPLAYGDMPEGIDSGHWAYAYVNYALKCGWLEQAGGDIRADEPITCAEAAHALDCVAENGWPTPGVDF